MSKGRTGGKNRPMVPWRDVRRQWNAMSGENLSRARVWQIGLAAEQKLRRAIAQVAVEMGVIADASEACSSQIKEHMKRKR